jgi:hypothetical protein
LRLSGLGNLRSDLFLLLDILYTNQIVPIASASCAVTNELCGCVDCKKANKCSIRTLLNNGVVASFSRHCVMCILIRDNSGAVANWYRTQTKKRNTKANSFCFPPLLPLLWQFPISLEYFYHVRMVLLGFGTGLATLRPNLGAKREFSLVFAACNRNQPPLLCLPRARPLIT